MATEATLAENSSFSRPTMRYPRPPNCGDMSFYFFGNFRTYRNFEAEELLFMSVGAIISFAAIAGNLVVIIVFLMTKEIRNSVPGIYKVSLACSDLIHGCLAPFIIFNEAQTLQAFLRFYIIWLCYFGLWLLSTTVSICTLSALALDRLCVIWSRTIKPSGSPKKIASIIISGIWAVSIVIAVIPTYFISTAKLGPIVSASGTLLIVLDLKQAYVAFFSTGLGLTVICNVALVYVIKSRLNEIGGLIANPNDLGRNRQHRKAAVTILIMSVAFVASVSPLAIYLSLPQSESTAVCFMPLSEMKGAIVHQYPRYNRRLEASIWLLYVTNGIWNCIIYSFRDASFRDAIKKIFKRIPSPRRDSAQSTQNTFQMQAVA